MSEDRKVVESRISTVPVEVVALEGGRVSMRIRLSDRLLTMTMAPEQACDLAFQLMAASAGRLEGEGGKG